MLPEISEMSLFVGLLRFGAMDASEKLRAFEKYDEQCALCPQLEGVITTPHLWNPSVEVMEQLWSFTNSCAHETFYEAVFKEEDRRLFGEITTVLDHILRDHHSSVEDRSIFKTPLCHQLSLLCAEAVTRLSSVNVEKISFWDLMCYSCG
jgi:hypothetical protein